MLSKILAAAGFAAVASAFSGNSTSELAARSFSCGSLAAGLTSSDCSYLSSMGMSNQGVNAQGNNGNIWIGNQGPNTITFWNKATDQAAIVVVVWDNPAGDYQSSFVNVRQPKITYSLSYGQSFTISLANGISGAWSGLYRHVTTLSQYGQIWNTWGEFTTGSYATVDITRLVHMGGNTLNAKVSTGCVADMNDCVFTCKSGDSCGDSGTYNLLNCQGTNKAYGVYNGNPSGGCQGWNNGGHIDAEFY